MPVHWRAPHRLASQEKLQERAGSSTLRDGHSEKVCHAAVREPAAALAALDAQRLRVRQCLREAEEVGGLDVLVIALVVVLRGGARHADAEHTGSTPVMVGPGCNAESRAE